MPESLAPISLYIHIPFCRIKCSYCAFNTYIHLDHLIAPFVQALIKEIQIVGAAKPGQVLGTVYFGGGTPNLLSPEQLDVILRAIRENFVLSLDAEISMESNPSDLDLDYLGSIRSLGINRLSIGMQSANAVELELFARRHDQEAVVRAVSASREAGFQNLNLDLIYGIPNQTLDGWKNSLTQMLQLQPEHISLYALGIEDGTSMKAWVVNGNLPTPDDDLAADMYELATEMLAVKGFQQYEISNWAKPGYECRHNLQYWRNLPYPGVGPGAHGYAGGKRYSTVLLPQKYIKLLHETDQNFEYPLTPAIDQAVVVSREAEIVDTLIMGLRLTQEGIRRDVFSQRFGIDLVELHRPIIERYEAHGLLHVDDQFVRITQKGRLLSNMIFRDLM